MATTESADGDAARPADTSEISRRDVLKTVSVAAGAALGVGALPESSPARADSPSSPGFGAPLIELHIPEGILSPEQKSAMIKGVTEVVVTALNAPDFDRKYLWVQIIEVPSGGWGIGGQVFVPRKKA
jgi:4-oxalocrotonate tautomerase